MLRFVSVGLCRDCHARRPWPGGGRRGAFPGRDPPKALAVLVDTSEAMQPHFNHVRPALRRFVAEMQTTHEISVVEFGERPAVLADYTSDPVRLKTSIDRIFARRGTGASHSTPSSKPRKACGPASGGCPPSS